MDEPGLRVPLVAHGPGIRAGGTPAELVATIDLAPTFIDRAGLTVPDWIKGRSLSWRKDAWELYDLVADPHELHNLLFDPAEAAKPEVAAKFAELTAEIAKPQQHHADDGRFADPATPPKDDVAGDRPGKEPLGV